MVFSVFYIVVIDLRSFLFYYFLTMCVCSEFRCLRFFFCFTFLNSYFVRLYFCIIRLVSLLAYCYWYSPCFSNSLAAENHSPTQCIEWKKKKWDPAKANISTFAHKMSTANSYTVFCLIFFSSFICSISSFTYNIMYVQSKIISKQLVKCEHWTFIHYT